MYNLTTLGELLYISFVRYLTEYKNYPNILNIFDLVQESQNLSSENLKFLNKENYYKFSGVELLIDYEFGNCLKISEDQIILKAIHGIKELNEKEIIEIYGKEMKIPKEYNYTYDVTKTDHYHYMMGYFEYQFSGIFSLCVELFDLGLLEIIGEERPYHRIFHDIFDALLFNYSANDKKMEESGYFYPEIFRNPKKYLCKNSARDALILIKKAGLKTFFATNSYIEFGELIIKNSLGEDYEDLFDLCISYSKKPHFFRLSSDLNQVGFKFPGCEQKKYDKEKILFNNLNEDQELFIELKEKKSIICQSFEVCELFFEKILQKKNLKYLYVGDSILNDCVSTAKNENIKVILIIEFIDSFYHGVKPDNLSEIWHLDIKKEIQQYHVKVAREHAEFSISNVQSLKLLC